VEMMAKIEGRTKQMSAKDRLTSGMISSCTGNNNHLGLIIPDYYYQMSNWMSIAK